MGPWGRLRGVIGRPVPRRRDAVIRWVATHCLQRTVAREVRRAKKPASVRLRRPAKATGDRTNPCELPRLTRPGLIMGLGTMLPGSEATMQRRRVRFEGRVQGVFFRATTRRCAASFDVSGWVRNEPDGSVLMEVQGEALELERFLAQHRQDRPGHVEREDSESIPPVEGETGFIVAG